MDNIKLSEEQFINMQESFMAFNRVFGIFFGVKKNKLNLIATILLILFVTLLQIVFVFPLAILKGYIILNTICIVYGFTPITFLILTAITEPGVILKKQINDNQEPESRLTESSDEAISIENMNKQEDLPKIYRTRFCSTCNIKRPPKASHCRECNHCVDGFDHHCYWVGTCIGIRNWRYFVYFLIAAFSAPLLAFFVGIVLFINQFSLATKLWFEMFDTLGISVLVFYIFYFICGFWRNATILNILALIILIFGPLLSTFSIFQNHNEFKQYNYYENPYFTLFVSLIMLMISISLLPMASDNCNNAAKFKTSKQIHSEEEFKREKRDFDFNNNQVDFKEIKNNLIKFITYPIPQSRYQNL
ncbi:unnamed protein product [Paramecium sonneborni]|uniref:Palmitoyltransferase n=1 Tax=Paramecium sonneborni TaxID=65129 RepID=A0A8S1LMH4_9CILI|nr:unnamed protein product [Paramecium sonneborni]